MNINNLSEKSAQIKEQGVIGDINNILTEHSTTEILNCLPPETLRKAVDIIDHARNLVDVDVSDLALYQEIYKNMGKKISFCGWLEKSIEEYKEYQRLALIGGEELACWLGTPGTSAIPKIPISYDLQMYDTARGMLLGQIERICDEANNLCSADNTPFKNYTNQCTWWGIKTRPERIAYVAWLKEIDEMEQAYTKRMSELLSDLREKAEKAREQAKDYQPAGTYYRDKIKAYYEQIHREMAEKEKGFNILANL